MNELHGLNKMTKKELREKLARDADAWMREHGKPDLYAAQTSPLEHFMICGSSMKRKHLKPNDPKHEAYQEWLEEEERRKRV